MISNMKFDLNFPVINNIIGTTMFMEHWNILDICLMYFFCLFDITTIYSKYIQK